VINIRVNWHDVSQFERLLKLIEIGRPDIFERPQHLCPEHTVVVL